MFDCVVDDGLTLCLLEHAHAEELYRLIDRNRAYLRTWLPWVEFTTSVEYTKSFIHDALKQYARNDGFQCGMFYQRKLVGCIGYHRFHWSNKFTSIGYWLAEDMQGKGIVTKCCRALIDYALNDMKLNRVEIRAGVHNAKSRAVAEKLGLTQEGVLRQSEWVNGVAIDHSVYAVLAEEWKSKD